MRSTVKTITSDIPVWMGLDLSEEPETVNCLVNLQTEKNSRDEIKTAQILIFIWPNSNSERE